MEVSSSANDVLIIVGVLAIYAVFARQLARAWISAALFLTGLGVALGPAGLGWYETTIGSSAAEILASYALATVLFGDATGVRLSRLRSNKGGPIRLLTIGLLGTVILGTVIAHAMFGGITWAIAMIIAVILAPTDAALGAPVVENPAVPDRVRESLFVESGLNDGIAVPLLVVALAWSDIQELSGPLWELLLRKLVMSAILGIVVAFAAFLMLRLAKRHGGTDHVWGSLVPLLTAVTCFALTEFLEGSGFIAAFVGGLTFGALSRRSSEQGVAVDEAVSALLQGGTWFLFGALVVGPVLWSGAIQLSWVLYAIGSLTIIRMVPVALALWGTHADGRTVAFIGWFGPRGLASVVFLLLVLGLGPDQPDATLIAGVVTVTVALSVILHGLTAAPLARRFAARTPATSGGGS